MFVIESNFLAYAFADATPALTPPPPLPPDQPQRLWLPCLNRPRSLSLVEPRFVRSANRDQRYTHTHSSSQQKEPSTNGIIFTVLWLMNCVYCESFLFQSIYKTNEQIWKWSFQMIRLRFLHSEVHSFWSESKSISHIPIYKPSSHQHTKIEKNISLRTRTTCLLSMAVLRHSSLDDHEVICQSPTRSHIPPAAHQPNTHQTIHTHISYLTVANRRPPVCVRKLNCFSVRGRRTEQNLAFIEDSNFED